VQKALGVFAKPPLEGVLLHMTVVDSAVQWYHVGRRDEIKTFVGTRSHKPGIARDSRHWPLARFPFTDYSAHLACCVSALEPMHGTLTEPALNPPIRRRDRTATLNWT